METEVYSKIFKIEEELWWYQGRRKVCFGLLDRFLHINPMRSILDVGCGTGLNLTYLADYGQATGVDMSPEAIRHCEKRGLKNVRLHEANELPFPNEAFELVTAFDVIEHIDDDRGALCEFERLLKPEGALLIYTPALPWMFNEHDRRVHHKRRYTKSELEEKIRSSGFEIDYISYVNLLILPIVLCARLYFKFLGNSHGEMVMPPRILNAFFRQICFLESTFLSRFSLPYGMTLVCFAHKPRARDSLQ